jgi:sterol desaturase/sphingolipid hydroxylase (fatty acid hydroxylase superfamily)
MDSSKLYLYALPVFVLAIVIEALYYRFVLDRPYQWSVAGANFVVAVGRLLSDLATKGLVLALYFAAHEFRPFDVPMDRWESWVALFFVVEIAYYWLHRYSHEIRWMWAQHSVHHSAQQISLSVAYRLGWTQFVAGPWLFLIPVCWLGFDPRAVLFMYAASLLYQFWLHTEAVGRLGWLEWLFNTPSHHRVHHAVEPEYLDRNYGGVLIVWDRLFGTFAEERPDGPRTYGLVRQIDTLNPVKIAFAEWAALFADLRRAKGPAEALGYMFRAPGWRPDGTGLTTRAIRAAAGIAEDSRLASPESEAKVADPVRA